MHVDIDPCEVCEEPNAKTISGETGFDGIHQDCIRCGEFKASGTACSMLRHLSAQHRAKLSGWIHDQNSAGAIAMITSENLPKILARPLPSVAERANALLIEAERGLKNLGDHFNIIEPRFMAATYSSNEGDVGFLTKLLEKQGLAEAKGLPGQFEISPSGYMQLDDARKRPSSSSQGFVAMWFDTDLDVIYSEGFEKGVLNAGYDPIRIDRVEHVNKIDDEIIKQINASKFLVADFTGHRGGVYFEAGYALGLGIPIFWTCRKDELAKLHFDIRQFNCIDWTEPNELATRLSTRIEAVLGLGPKKPQRN